MRVRNLSLLCVDEWNGENASSLTNPPSLISAHLWRKNAAKFIPFNAPKDTGTMNTRQRYIQHFNPDASCAIEKASKRKRPLILSLKTCPTLNTPIVLFRHRHPLNTSIPARDQVLESCQRHHYHQQRKTDLSIKGK